MQEWWPAWGGRISVGIVAVASGSEKSRRRMIGEDSTISCGSDQVGSRRPPTVRSHVAASSITSTGVAPRSRTSVQYRVPTDIIWPATSNHVVVIREARWAAAVAGVSRVAVTRASAGPSST